MVMARKEVETGHLLHLTAASGDGRVSHTIRYESGNWEPFEDIEATAGKFYDLYDVDLQSMGESVYLCVVDKNYDVYLTNRTRDGYWHHYEDVKYRAGKIGLIGGVSICATGGYRDGQLHIFAIAHTGSTVYEAIFNADGTWVGFVDISRVRTPVSFGYVRNLATTGDISSPYDLHLCGVSWGGYLYHSIRNRRGDWSSVEDVRMKGAGDSTEFFDVDCEMVGRELHIIGLTYDGKLLYTVRNTAGTYSTFYDIRTDAGNPGNISRVTVGGTNGQLQIVATTDDKRLWHSLLNTGTGKFSPFENIATLVEDRGPFVAAGVHGLQVI